MNELKAGLSLVVIANICYVLYIYFSKDNTTNLSDFLSGLILGSSVGANIVGIRTIAKYIPIEFYNDAYRRGTKLKDIIDK